MFHLKNGEAVVGEGETPFALDDAGLVWTQGEARIYDPTRTLTQVWAGAGSAPSDFTVSSVPNAGRLPILSPVAFKMCFTVQERIGLKALRASDQVVDDWMVILDDPRLSGVDLNLASTKAAVDYLVGKLAGFDATRAAKVKAGQVL